MQYVNSIHINLTDRLSMLYSASVIGAVRDIFGALLTGASVHLLSVTTLGVSGVLAAIDQRKLTILHAVPVMYRQLTQHANASGFLQSVRLLYLAGDRLDKADAQVFQQLFSATSYLYTGIGSTENATIYRQWFITPQTTLAEFDTLPVGRAISDRSVRIIDESGNTVPLGDIGEIEVTSRFMALGYWQNKVLSEQCFKTCATDAAARVFKTGDLAAEGKDGLLRFYGRKDARIKLRGYLISPPDIEVVAKMCKGITEAAVHVRTNTKGAASAMVLYWQGEPALSEQAVRQFLSLHLTLPQMPAHCYKIPAIPLLANFKIDRQKLAILDQFNHEAPTNITSYTNDALGRTMQTLAEVMSQAQVSAEDNIDTLYADSLDTLRMMLALEHEFAISIDAAQFYHHFTSVAKLAAFINSQLQINKAR